jgi:AcrR family transcriptional regulator
MAATANRKKIIEAFLALLAEKPFNRIGLSAVATRAEVSLADVRGEFGSTFDMLAAWMRETDRKVLGGGDPEDADATARERLFDVLMRRLEALASDRAAVRSLGRSARRDPALAWGLNRLAVRSQQWMLAAAGIDSAGLKGQVRAQALVVLFGRVIGVWLRDDDPGLARTMAALDRELASAERCANMLGDLCRLLPRSSSRPRPPQHEDSRRRPAESIHT